MPHQIKHKTISSLESFTNAAASTEKKIVTRNCHDALQLWRLNPVSDLHLGDDDLVCSFALFLSEHIGAAHATVAIPNITAHRGAWDEFHNFTGCRSGERRDGLNKLKEYFHYFGYIPEATSNFTDDFDDALEEAIKTYQKNFNLDPTGELDDATLKQIVLPRCGNADIVNGSTSMNSGKPTSVFHSDSLPDAAKSAVARAFQKWAEVTPLTFTETSSYDAADITIAFFTGDHGDGEPFDGVLGTLAHAFSPTNGRFHLDGAENWVVEGDVTKSSVSTAVDLESVAVHEIGHLLGLGHSSVTGAIMYPTISAQTRKVDLAADDIQGIQVLYGSNPNYNGSSPSTPTSTTQKRETSQAHAIVRGPTAVLVLSVALGVLLL
ncbi:hypothetical protein SAY87_028874 [Trapa incisa]|uniref:Peptidase metallopeptidase domain-containing protein n=1 Tax=Trapa incisa TaxID=236973 RepID=A0AAN7QSF6_9MYRT|nr:hypothetical protein SAY87_028874 [Trapa incisa]